MGGVEAEKVEIAGLLFSVEPRAEWRATYDQGVNDAIGVALATLAVAQRAESIGYRPAIQLALCAVTAWAVGGALLRYRLRALQRIDQQAQIVREMVS